MDQLNSSGEVLDLDLPSNPQKRALGKLPVGSYHFIELQNSHVGWPVSVSLFMQSHVIHKQYQHFNTAFLQVSEAYTQY